MALSLLDGRSEDRSGWKSIQTQTTVITILVAIVHIVLMIARLELVCTTPPARQLSVWTLGLSLNHSDLSMSQQVLVRIVTASSYSLLLLGPPHSPLVLYA